MPRLPSRFAAAILTFAPLFSHRMWIGVGSRRRSAPQALDPFRKKRGHVAGSSAHSVLTVGSELRAGGPSPDRPASPDAALSFSPADRAGWPPGRGGRGRAHTRRHHGPCHRDERRLSSLRCRDPKGPQPLPPHARRSALAGPRGLVARLGPPLPLRLLRRPRLRRRPARRRRPEGAADRTARPGANQHRFCDRRRTGGAALLQARHAGERRHGPAPDPQAAAPARPGAARGWGRRLGLAPGPTLRDHRVRPGAAPRGGPLAGPLRRAPARLAGAPPERGRHQPRPVRPLCRGRPHRRARRRAGGGPVAPLGQRVGRAARRGRAPSSQAARGGPGSAPRGGGRPTRRRRRRRHRRSSPGPGRPRRMPGAGHASRPSSACASRASRSSGSRAGPALPATRSAAGCGPASTFPTGARRGRA